MLIRPAQLRSRARQASGDAPWHPIIDGRSSALLNVNGNPYGAPQRQGSIYQAFPSTAAQLLQWLGNPVGWGTANVLAIYQCDTASPLVDSLGGGPNLVAAGAPLTGRECVGLPTTSFVAKTGIELLAGGADSFISANAAFMDVGATAKSFLWVMRLLPAGPGTYEIFGKDVGNGAPAGPGYLVVENAGNIFIRYSDGVGWSQVSIAGFSDSSWRCFGLLVDGVAFLATLFTDAGPISTAAQGGTPANAAFLTIGNAGAGTAARCQIAYIACFDLAITEAMRAAFWRNAQAAGIANVPATYTRASQIVVPMSTNRVACFGNGQVAPGYRPEFAVELNAVQTGIVTDENWDFFLGIGSTNPGAWTYGIGGGSPVVVDGPDGMRSAIRAVDANAGAAEYVQTDAANLAGATNVSFVVGFLAKSVGGGGNAFHVTAYFAGDPGGPEELTVLDSAPPADWDLCGLTKSAGAAMFWGNVTPARAAHTTVRVRLYPTDGVAASQGTVDFAEVFVMGDGAIPPVRPLAGWMRVGAGAHTSLAATQALLTPGVGQFNPQRGRIVLGFAGTQEEPDAVAGPQPIFAAWNGVNGNGAMTIYRSGVGTNIDFGMNDAAGAVVAFWDFAFGFGGAGPDEHTAEVLWDCQSPVYSTGGVDYYAIGLHDGVVVLPGAGGLAPWTMPAAGTYTNIGLGGALGFVAGNLTVRNLEIFNEPGGVP